MQAYLDGAEIQYRKNDGSDWKDILEPRWYWDELTYRVKPEKIYREWTQGEIPLGQTVVRKSTKESYYIVSINLTNNTIRICLQSRRGNQYSQDYDYYSLDQMLKFFTLDGKPCGALNV